MRANIIQERAVPTGSSRTARFYRDQGYRTELQLIDTRHFESWTSVPGRADRAMRNGHIGTNVLVPRRSHDECYAGWARAFYDAERYKQFDRVHLAARDGSTTYENHLVMGADGTKDWAKPPQGLDALLLARHRSITDRDAASVTSAWQSATTNPQLRSAVPDWPLNAYAKEVTDFVWSPASRFDPFSKKPSNSPQAARQWTNFIRNDLHLTRSSRNQMGYSKEFDDRTHQYGLAMIDMGRKAIHVEPAALQHVSAPQQVLSSNAPPAQPASRKRRHQEPTANEATAAAAPLKIRAGGGATKRRRLQPRDDRVRGGAIEV